MKSEKKNMTFLITLLFGLILFNLYICICGKPGTSNEILNKIYDLNIKNSAWNWTNTVVVSTTGLPSEHPDIAVDIEGNVHITWQENNDIYYRYYDITTSNWSITELVSTETTATAQLPSIGVDKELRVHIIWYDNTNYMGAGTDMDVFYKCKEINKTWTTTEVVSTESTMNLYSMPKLAVGPDSTIHVVWNEDRGGSDWDILYKKKPPGGTWIGFEEVCNATVGLSYRPDIFVDAEGSVHVVWLDDRNFYNAGGDWDIFYRYWDVETNNWMMIEVVSTESTSDSFVPSVAVDGEGSAHVVWFDLTDLGCGTDQDIFYKYRNAITSNWTVTEVLTQGFDGGAFHPVITTDVLDNLHVAWHDTTNYNGSGSDFDIIYRRWNNTLGIWMAPEVVSTGSSVISRRPNIAVDNIINVHIVWQDTMDYDGAGTDWDIFYQSNFVESGPSPSKKGFVIPGPDLFLLGFVILFTAIYIIKTLISNKKLYPK